MIPLRKLAVCTSMIASAPLLADEISGEFSLGWRDVSVDGDVSKYDEDINLGEGPRLFGAAIAYRAADPDGKLPHFVSIDVEGIGGDPFESMRLEARHYGSWRFRASRLTSDYAYDDLLVLPANASIEGSTGGDFHRFDFERVRDEVALDVALSEQADLTLGFDRYSKHGESTTTIDVQRDEFELDRPIDEEMQRLRAGFVYRWDRVTVSVEEQLNDYESDSRAFLPGFSTGENPDDLATLDLYFLDQPYEYREHAHIARVNARPSDRWRLKAAVSLSSLDMDVGASERAQGIDFTGSPFATEETGAGTAARDTAIYDAGASFSLNERLELTAGVARREFDQDAETRFGTAGGGQSDWAIDTTSYDLGVLFAASRALSLSAGWYGDRRDVRVDRQATGGAPLRNREDTDSGGFYARIEYRPDDRFSLRASINENDIDDPFTLATATDARRLRIRARYSFDNGISISADHSRTDLDNAVASWSTDTRQSGLRLSYATADLSVSLGAWVLDGSRHFERLVTGGTRQDLFDVDYSADTTYADAALRWTLDERWQLGGAWRHYDNDGDFPVNRDDLEGFVEIALPREYALRLSWREVDFEEDRIETYDARILEAAVRLAF